VLYLAEVQKKSGVFGSGKAGLKLLAQQRSEQNWSPASGDEIPFDDPSGYGAGVLVMAEVGANKQVQGTPREAGPQLVKILQSFSRFQEKTKTQEEEIDQWKASLTYQAEELNRRETEIQGREEEVERINEQLEALEARKAEIEAENSKIEAARGEVERSKQELESAWTQFQGERESFAAQSASLDAEQANSLKEWLDYLAEVVATADDPGETIATIEAQVETQQTVCDERKEQIAGDREQIADLEADRDRQSGELQELRETVATLVGELAGLQSGRDGQQAIVEAKQQLAATIADRIAEADALALELSQLAVSGGGEDDSDIDVNLDELERLPLNDLQQKVRQLQDELEKGFRFVSDQEEELTMQRMDMNEIEAKLARASGDERESLQQEFADNQESFKFLNQTLVGQRRNLRKQERVLNLHQNTLWRRLGNPPEGTASVGSVDTSAIGQQIQQKKDEQAAALDALENEIAELQAALASTDGKLSDKQQELDEQTAQIEERVAALDAAKAAVERTQERIESGSALLEAFEAPLAELRSGCDRLKEHITTLSETKASQENAISQLQEVVNGLMA